MDCTSAGASGCWDHRRNMLSSYGPHPAMGAAATMVDGVTSMTELLTSGPAGALEYSMPVVTQLVSPSSLVIGTTPRQPNSATLTIRDGNSSFQASATVSGNAGRWSVTPLCTASAGTTCHLVVDFVPLHSGPANGTVTVNLPGGSEQVQVNAFAGHGYWEATTQGGVFGFAGGGLRGSAAGLKLVRPVTGIVATPDGGGYWEVAADGGVFSFGDAHFYGSAADLGVRQPFVGMAATPDGGGYWLVARTGNIYTFGDAKNYGGPDVPVTDIVGISATKDGRGYWLVASDGTVYSFGDAQFCGAPTVPAEGEFVGMAVSPDGHGYWLVTNKGNVFSFGDAKYYGSATGSGAGATVGMAVPVTGTGYYIVDADGAVVPFGGAPAWGSAPDVTPKSPVVAMAAA
jgi:ribosomal protein L24E